MQQNPSQGIKKYFLDGVYTPEDSNARRERTAFDFVVTENQLQAYKSKHPAGSALDLGDIIWSLADGSEGPAPAEADRPGRPIHILIDAPTTEADVFEFYTSRLAHDSLKASLLAEWSRGSDRAYVHVYSRGPYTAQGIGGGYALHSTAESCVTLLSPIRSGRDGVFRIGTCKVQDGGTVNTYGRPGYSGNGGFTIVYEKCLSGEITWQAEAGSSRPADAVTPGAVCAAWMSGNVDCVIDVDRSQSRQYALFARIAQALQYGSQPRIRAVNPGSYDVMQLVSYTGASYIFEGNGKRLVVGSNDSLSWSSLGASGSAPAVIRDYNISRGRYSSPTIQGNVDLSFLRSVSTWLGDDVKVLREGGNDFVTVAADTEADVLWYNPSSAFDVKSSTTVDWYTWSTISAPFVQGDNYNVSWIYNPNNWLYINVGRLAEGIVYEVNLHVMRLPGPVYDVTVAPGVTLPAGLQLAPNETAEAPTECPNQIFAIGLYDAAGRPSPAKCWGSTASVNTAPHACYFACVKNAALGANRSPDSPVYQLDELASGRVQFVKLGGTVYIMRY